MAVTSGSIKMDGPYPRVIGPQLIMGQAPQPEQTVNKTIEDGVLKIDNADGTTTIDFNPTAEDAQDNETDSGNTEFDRNLAKSLDDSKLSEIASNLLEGIASDEQSRKKWLETRALGIGLLGLELEKPRSDTGNASAPLEGMSTVRHPLLLEATVSFQATARAELLPASGPVKVRNDTPFRPPAAAVPSQAPNDPNNPTPSLPPPESTDDLAQALEKDFNHYLTVVATEYVPDTDRMLFYVGFGGDGFKKVYNCPLRRRPVSESIDAEDLIVSNAATDLGNCSRVTHHIRMRKSVLRRMQILGVYRDVDLAPPPPPPPNPVEKKKDDIAGHNPSVHRPEDRDYDIYEIYCELDIDKFAPKAFKGKGLPLPYRVTIEKGSQKVLDIRRNWDEADEQCMAKEYFVQFPLIRGLGFYGLGYIHLLGNTTIALTAAWRLQLDNGMFANFPGFLYSKGIGRQLTNQFRVPPGGGVGLDIGAQQNIRDAVMPLPYKETGPSFSAFSTHVEEVGRRLASTANINVGEGKQDAPVGTTLALIEQATKVMDSAHKRLHAAQAKEFKLLKERFKEDPEAMWRHNKHTTIQWDRDQFLKALENNNIVPVADPNNPTSLHRMAKAMAVKELQKASPDLYDPVKVDLKVGRMADINIEEVMRPAPANPAPDPRLVAIQQKAESVQKQNEIQLMEAQIKAQAEQAQIEDKAKDRESRERIENMKLVHERLRIQEESIIHGHQDARDAAAQQQDMQLKAQEKQHEMQMEAASKMQDLHHENISRTNTLYADAAKQHAENKMAEQRHNAELTREAQKHALNLAHERELQTHKVEAAKQMASVAKRDKTKKPKKES